jgi:hypothetical protein
LTAIDTDKLAKAIAEAAEEYERQHGHLPSKARVTLSKSERQDLVKTYQELSNEDAKREVIRKYAGNLDLAEAAEAIQKRDGGTYEAAVLVALEDDPELYQP